MRKGASNSQPDSPTINAMPTKEFFISMLVKDIELLRAILDLVDNSIDGARRIRPNGDYTNLWIRLEVSSERFRIADNCGGMSVDVARNYAFRFGRPKGMTTVSHSIGEFGVGMKRALFKLGNRFAIESWSERAHFLVDIDVKHWKLDPDKWEFQFAQVEEMPEPVPEDKRGTIISVTALHRSVREDLQLENVRTRLANELEKAHMDAVDRGLRISLNQVPLHIRRLVMLQSADIASAHRVLNLQEPNQAAVTVNLYAGLGESDPAAAGWYVFCNGRLVLGADQSAATGWGHGAEKRNPKYHNQFARFRGYAFFDSDDGSLLPWTTTKTGVDTDSAVFRTARSEMTRMMRPVIDFLNRLDAEINSGDAALETAVEEARRVRLAEIVVRENFQTPNALSGQVPGISEPKDGRISYTRPWESIRRAQELLEARNPKEVGEKTFDYFLRNEG